MNSPRTARNTAERRAATLAALIIILALCAIFFVIDVAEDLLAVSNGPELERTPLDGGRVRIRFADTMPMSTYLVAFVVGPLEVTGPIEDFLAFVQAATPVVKAVADVAHFADSWVAPPWDHVQGRSGPDGGRNSHPDSATAFLSPVIPDEGVAHGTQVASDARISTHVLPATDHESQASAFAT